MSPILCYEKKLEKDKIRFITKKTSFLVASPLNSMVEKIGNLFGEIEIGGNICNLVKTELVDNVEFEEEMLWRTFPGSGICTKDPRKIKGETFIFPNTIDKEHCEKALSLTLQTKWQTLCKEQKEKAIRWCEDESPEEWGKNNSPKVEIVHALGRNKEKIKDKAIALCWGGTVKITGNPAWQRLIWDTGLGIKTGVGFGMVEPKRERQ
jgi:CRISPR-associated endoribonuclease Cas6